MLPLFNRKLKSENAELQMQVNEAVAALRQLGCYRSSTGEWWREIQVDSRDAEKLRVLRETVDKVLAHFMHADPTMLKHLLMSGLEKVDDIEQAVRNKRICDGGLFTRIDQ